MVSLGAEAVSRQFIRKRAGSNMLMAVRDVSLTLNGGEITVLYGPSGSGKSTLLSMMAGILKPTGGRVLLDGTDIYTLNDTELSHLRNDCIGVVPQGQTAVSSLTVLENVLLPYTLYKKRGGRETGKTGGNDADELLKKVKGLLSKVDIAELADVMPRELSGGELRRMAVVRALTNSPDAILADEPTADLDSDSAEAVMGLLRRASEEGRAVMIVTHDPMVMEYADRKYIMENGIIKLDAGEDKDSSYEE